MGLIEKDQLTMIECRDLLTPEQTSDRILLAGNQRLFLRVIPNRWSQRPIVGTLTDPYSHRWQ